MRCSAPLGNCAASLRLHAVPASTACRTARTARAAAAAAAPGLRRKPLAQPRAASSRARWPRSGSPRSRRRPTRWPRRTTAAGAGGASGARRSSRGADCRRGGAAARRSRGRRRRAAAAWRRRAHRASTARGRVSSSGARFRFGRDGARWSPFGARARLLRTPAGARVKASCGWRLARPRGLKRAGARAGGGGTTGLNFATPRSWARRARGVPPRLASEPRTPRARAFGDSPAARVRADVRGWFAMTKGEGGAGGAPARSAPSAEPRLDDEEAAAALCFFNRRPAASPRAGAASSPTASSRARADEKMRRHHGGRARVRLHCTRRPMRRPRRPARRGKRPNCHQASPASPLVCTRLFTRRAQGKQASADEIRAVQHLPLREAARLCDLGTTQVRHTRIRHASG